MIKCEFGNVRIDGMKPIVSAELTMLIRGFKKNDFSKDEILRFVDIAYMSDEEVKNDNERLDREIKEHKKVFLEKVAPELVKALGEIIKDCQEDVEEDGE